MYTAGSGRSPIKGRGTKLSGTPFSSRLGREWQARYSGRANLSTSALSEHVSADRDHSEWLTMSLKSTCRELPSCASVSLISRRSLEETVTLDAISGGASSPRRFGTSS